MRSLQGTFSRLKTRLTGNSSQRAQLIRICLFLFNLRNRRIGMQQARTVYELYWRDGVIDDAEYDRVDAWYADEAPAVEAALAAGAEAPERAESKRSTRPRREMRLIVDED